MAPLTESCMNWKLDLDYRYLIFNLEYENDLSTYKMIPITHLRYFG